MIKLNVLGAVQNDSAGKHFVIVGSTIFNIIQRKFYWISEIPLDNTERLHSHWEDTFLLSVVISFHLIVNLPSGFDLFPIVKTALLLGCKIQKITYRPVWLPVLPEQIKSTIDVRYLFRIKIGLVIITGKTDNTVHNVYQWSKTSCYRQLYNSQSSSLNLFVFLGLARLFPSNLSLCFLDYLYVNSPF